MPTLDCAACQEGPIAEDTGAGVEGGGGAALTLPEHEFSHL